MFKKIFFITLLILSMTGIFAQLSHGSRVCIDNNSSQILQINLATNNFNCWTGSISANSRACYNSPQLGCRTGLYVNVNSQTRNNICPLAVVEMSRAGNYRVTINNALDCKCEGPRGCYGINTINT